VIAMTVTSWGYIRDNFRPEDRLALVIKNSDRLVQRIATAEQLAGPRFQSWIRLENVRGGNIYVSMNPLKPDAQGRTKQDIAVVRHVYLDLDQNGPQALSRILSDPQLPTPSYVLNTSTGKYQIIWKVDGFGIAESERLQKAMAYKHNADRAATDVTRVLRIPGLQNCKYDPHFQVTAEKLSDSVRFPSDFRIESQLEGLPARQIVTSRMRSRQGLPSQSERDWAETLRRLEHGEDPAAVQAWLEHKRQDKPDPGYYAALTVRKALAERESRRTADTAFDLSR
jgi:hypothetical protein